MNSDATTALVKTANSPALARVSSQLALTDKLLAKPEEPFLIPYRKGDKWGFCDRNKNIVIDCIYDEVELFQNRRAAVRLNNKWGFCDKKKVVVDCVYDSVGTFEFEFSTASLNGKSGVIDRNGNIIIPLRYRRVIIYSHNIGCIYDDGKSIFFKIKDFKALSTQYQYIDKYSGDLMRVFRYKYGFIDKEGEEKIPLKYDSAEPFHNGLAKVTISNRVGLINTLGEEVIPIKYNSIGDFSHGYYRVTLNNSNCLGSPSEATA